MVMASFKTTLHFCLKVSLALTWQRDMTDYTLVTIFHNTNDVLGKELL